MKEDLVWGCAATKSTTSMSHIDDSGLATAIQVMTGSKYWVLMQSVPGEREGNLRSRLAASRSFTCGDSGKGLWRAEGMHIKDGMVL
jgi:hypothetical protein